jgi:hypothetical protein
MNEQKGFYEHLRNVPNPNPERKTKGGLEKFDRHSATMAAEALRRTNAEPIEYDVRPADEDRIKEIEDSVQNGPKQGETR